MIDELRACYTDFLKLAFPIPMCHDRMIEIENRLRFLEQKQAENVATIVARKENIVKRGMRCLSENGIAYTLRRALSKAKRRS
jgi:hypothetical protein